MAYPTKPSIQTSYTAVEQALGDGSLPGQELDTDFANLKSSVDALNDFVRGVTRSDGRLANRSVSRETLGPDIVLGFDAPTTWATGEAYAPPQTVFESDAFYICVIAHTAGASFAADLSAGRWELLVDFSAVLSGALAAKAGAEAALAEFRTRYIGAAGSDPATDPAGGALIDGALYWNTSARRLKVYDLGTTAWYFVAPTPAEQTAINTVAGVSANVTTVAGVSANVTTVAGISANVTTVAGIASDVTAVAGVAASVPTVAGIDTEVAAVAGIAPDVTTVAEKIADVTNFADVYLGPAALNPTVRSDGSALQVGDLYFNTVAGLMRVYDGAAWIAASSAVNGTSRRQTFTATAGQTVFTVTGGYDGGFVDVYLNGVKLVNGVDVTVTSGADVVLAVGASGGDVVDVVAYGSFVLANTYTQAEVDAKFTDTALTGTPTAPTPAPGDNSTKVATTAFVAAAVAPFTGRNRIINGNFDIWQEGTSGTSGYVADQWATFLAGSTAAISQQSFALGQTAVPGEPRFFHRVAVTSVAGAANFAISGQRIEGVRTFAGQTATLSFWAKADAAKNIAVEFLQNFGSGGSPSAEVNGIGVSTITLTAGWQKFVVPVTLPSISGKLIGTDNNDFLGVSFWFDAGSDWNARSNSLGQQSGIFDIAQVQLEPGSIANPFEYRSYAQELALCQRYFQIVLAQAVGNPEIGFAFGSHVTFSEMRGTPTFAQVANNVLFTQVGVSSTTSSYTGDKTGVTVFRDATATFAQFSERFSASARL